MYTAALFKIVNWKQPHCLPLDDWLSTQWYIAQGVGTHLEPQSWQKDCFNLKTSEIQQI